MNKIDCDQVADVLRVFREYEETLGKFCNKPKNFKSAIKLGFLFQIMDILNLEFEDNRASGNALHEITEFNELRGINQNKN